MTDGFGSLPTGHTAQPAWGFHDLTGRFSYELHRVYGPPRDRDARGSTCQLVEDLSYWEVTWKTITETGDERPAGRWLTFAQARELRRPRMTFERFSSSDMREVLPELLNR